MAVLNNTGILMGAAAAVSGDEAAYEIKRSLKFDDGNSAHMKWWNSRADRSKMTLAYWHRGQRHSNSDQWTPFFTPHLSGGNYTTFSNYTKGRISFSSNEGGGSHMWGTNYRYRDPANWMHVVIGLDFSLHRSDAIVDIWVNGIPQECDRSWSSIYGWPPGFEGGNGWQISQTGTACLADMYFINGLKLGSDAFGKFDDNMIWVPKAFKLPNPNDGTVWSTDGVTQSNWGGHSSGDYALYRFFDGILDRQAGNYDGTGNRSSVEWSTPIKYNTSLRVNAYLDGRSNNLSLDVTTDKGVITKYAYDSPGDGNEQQKWHTIAVGPGSFSKITLDEGNCVYGLEVDGQILMDGKIDPVTYSNPNTGHQWSDHVTGTHYSSTYSVDKAFDGRDDTVSVALDNGSTHQFLPYKTITADKQIRLDLTIFNGSTANMLKCNGTDLTSDARSNATAGSFYNSRGWYCLDSKTIDTTNGLEWKSASDSEQCQIWRIEVDGITLVDLAQDQSFHMTFEDNATQKALGANDMGTQLADSEGNQLTGDAFPIRKTNNGGNKTISGVRDDKTSGGTDVSSYCVLAWDVSGDSGSGAGVDVSPSIHGGGASAKTITKQGSDSSTELSSNTYKWYERSAYKASTDGTYYEIADASNLDQFSGDFCIEFWVNLQEDDNEQVVVCKGGKNIQSTNESNAWGFFIDNDTLQFGCSSSGSSNDICGQNDLDCSKAGELDNYRNQWVHYAVSRQGATFRSFQNGKLIDTHTDPAGSGGATTVNNSSDTVIIGANRLGQESCPLYMQDLRIYDGHAKYTAAFDIPQKAQFAAVNITHADSSASGWINVDSDLNSPTHIVPEGGDTGVGGEISGNYCQLNQYHCTYMDDADDFSEAGQVRHSPGSKWHQTLGTIGVTSGKWYWESRIGSGQYDSFGIMDMGVKMNNGDWINARTGQWAYYPYDSKTYKGGVTAGVDYPLGGGQGDLIMCALDMDNKKVWWGKNGTWGTPDGGSVGDPANGTDPAYTLASSELPSGRVTPTFWTYNTTAKTYHNFGSKPFKHTAPSGFKCLVDANLPECTIKNGKDHFEAIKYFGTGSAQDIKGLNFSPGLVIIKETTSSSSVSSLVQDVIQGTGKGVHTDSRNTQWTDSGTITAFNSDGFTLGTHALCNAADKRYIAYCWNAGSSVTPSSSYDITPTSQHVNQDAGFSITKYSGNGSDSQTLPHGLGKVPEFVMIKRLNANVWWNVKHKNHSSNNIQYLNDKEEEGLADGSDHGHIGDLNNVNTVSLETNGTNYTNTNASDGTYIMYAWTSIEGYSAFGTYIGLHDGDKAVYQYTGFEPQLVLMKKRGATQAGADHWFANDRALNPWNGKDQTTFMMDSDGGVDTHSNYNIDFFSSGFRQGSSNGPNHNGGDGVYIYAAWASSPFKHNNGI